MNRTVKNALSKTPLVTIGPGQSVFEASVLMAERRTGSALVYENGAMVGIITERDLLSRVMAKAADPASTSVREAMTPNPMTVRAGSCVTHALFLMKENGFRHLPVVEDGAVVGVFSVRDALPDEAGGADRLSEFYERICSAAA